MSTLSNNTISEIEVTDEKLSFKTVIAVLILIFHTIATPIFHKIKFHYIHESGICMILGAIIAYGVRPVARRIQLFLVQDII